MLVPARPGSHTAGSNDVIEEMPAIQTVPAAGYSGSTIQFIENMTFIMFL
jgi:hypothetical protein